MSVKRVLIITSDHLRHRWFAGTLRRHVDVVGEVIESKPQDNPASTTSPDPRVSAYFRERDAAEERWFGCQDDTSSLHDVLRGPWGFANDEAVLTSAQRLNPDVVVLFGCSIVRPPLLSRYQGRIVNMHLGLSPYYRGSSTNFWPLVDGLPECVGVTIHHATMEVDGGDIVFQARPMMTASDTSHDIGCKTIMAGAQAVVDLLVEHASEGLPTHPQHGSGRLCRRSDFNATALTTLLERLAGGLISAYLEDKPRRDAGYPIFDTLRTHHATSVPHLP